MRNYTLGIDLGSSSIGWAIVDVEGDGVVAAGVRVFPEGVDRDQQGGEKSKGEQRRIARSMRRQIARRARRKAALRRLLVLSGLLPEDAEAQRALDQLDAYTLRAHGLDQELTPHEFGRVLIHLNQRRGFLSNRKADRARKKENSEMLAEISALAAEIQAAGHRTLGEHLAGLRGHDGLARIRGKHTHREMLEREFRALWESQRAHHPQLLTEQLREKIHAIIFFQRAMYWPRSVIGACELEPKLKRCPRADRVAQRFRLLQEVNNLRVIPPSAEPRPLLPDERDKLISLLERAKEETFDKIRKRLNLTEGYGFNLEAGDRKKLKGMPTDHLLAKPAFFGKEWYSRSEEDKNRIVRSLLEDDEEKIRALAASEWGLPDEAVAKLVEIDFDDGYARFSRAAIEKLLPHLERGLPLMKGNDGESCALEAAGYLRPDQRAVNQRDLLPAPPEVANPLVRQALFEARKLLNAIIREYGKPAAIHIELAREVKGNAEDRKQTAFKMRDRERVRDEAAERIRATGAKATRETIDRYLLWQEQGMECIYSGRPISLSQLLGGEVDVDHILPYSRSLDNSLMNKVVAFRSENAAKGDRTPYEWLAEVEPKKYEAVLQRAARLPFEIRNRKRQKFVQKTVELNEFINRQLVDTAYIARTVADYVRCLGTDVVCSKGQLTAELRYRWGLNEILRDDGLNLKNREDHRHHAVDAIVIALTDRSRMQKLAATRRRDAPPESLGEPWPGFRGEVEFVVNGINVSHRATRRISGHLHEETIYGPTQKRRFVPQDDRPWARRWIEKEGEFVCRKPLEALTLAMVDDIRDPEVKRVVVERLAQFDIKPGTKQKIPKDVWKEPLYLTRKGRRKSANPSVVKKVRLIRRDLTIQPIRNGQAFVKPGNTHHIVIFEIPGKGGKRKREMVSVSMLQAVDRVKRGEPIIQRTHPTIPDARFIMSLSAGEMVLANIKGQERLLCYRTSASTQGQIYFVDHRDARKSADTQKFVANANTLNARKVTVDMLGRIRWAND